MTFVNIVPNDGFVLLELNQLLLVLLFSVLDTVQNGNMSLAFRVTV